MSGEYVSDDELQEFASKFMARTDEFGQMAVRIVEQLRKLRAELPEIVEFARDEGYQRGRLDAGHELIRLAEAMRSRYRGTV